MSQHQTPLIVALDSHWLLGNMRLSEGQRVSDVLNESMTEYVRLDDVKFFLPSDRKSVQAALPQVTVLKNRLQLVINPSDRYEIPKMNRLHRIAEKSNLQGAVVVGGYLVRGTFHLKKRTHDAAAVLTESLDRYFPVTSATVTGSSTSPIEATTVLANRDFVSCISCSGSTTVPHTTPDVEATLNVGRTQESPNKRPLLVDLF